HVARGQGADVIVPAYRQPFAHWQLLELHFEAYSLVFARAGRALGPNKSVALGSRRELELVKREQCFGDEQMRVPQSQIGNKRALHRPAGRLIFEIAAVRSDEQTCAEKASLLVPESPRYVGRLGPNFAEINPVRQKHVIPWLARRRLWRRLV